MNKTLLTLTSAGCLAMTTGIAHAQSSVTLYGIVDAGVSYINNVGTVASGGAAGNPATYVNRSRTAFASGSDYGDRWGLKGREDLGDGLAAIFQLENGFNVGSGAFASSGTEFNRQAFMGLTSNQVGSLTFGRQYEAITDLLESYGPDFTGGIGVYPGDLSNYDNSIRINNSVKYTTLNWNGFTGVVLYGLGGVAGSLGRDNTISVGGNYVRGPVVVGAAYLRMDNSGATTNAWSGSADGNFGSSVTAGYAGAKRVQIADAVAAYTFNALTLGLNYGFTQYQPSAFSSFQQTVGYNSFGVAARYVITPALTLTANASYTLGQAVAEGASRPRYQSIAMAAFYNLSTRTAFYVYGGYQHANGKTLDAYGNVVSATASLGDSANGVSSGSGNQLMAKVGIFSKF